MSAPAKASLAPAEFLAELRRRGIGIVAEGDALRVRWTPEGRKPRVEEYLRRNKPALLDLLREMEPEALPAEATGERSQSLPEDPEVPDLEAGRTDLLTVEALVELARDDALPPVFVLLNPERSLADANAQVRDLWDGLREAKAAGRIADAKSLAGELLTLVDWWEYPGLSDTSDIPDPFVDDPDEAALGVEPALAL